MLRHAHFDWLRWLTGGLILVAAPLLAQGGAAALGALAMVGVAVALHQRQPLAHHVDAATSEDVLQTNVSVYAVTGEDERSLIYDRATLSRHGDLLTLRPSPGLSWALLRWMPREEAIEVALLDLVNSRVVDDHRLQIEWCEVGAPHRRILLSRLEDANRLGFDIGIHRIPLSSLRLDL